MENNSQFAKDLRQSLHLTQREVAHYLKLKLPFENYGESYLHRETIGRYERGTQPVPEWYVAALENFRKNGVRPLVVDFPFRISEESLNS